MLPDSALVDFKENKTVNEYLSQRPKSFAETKKLQVMTLLSDAVFTTMDNLNLFRKLPAAVFTLIH